MLISLHYSGCKGVINAPASKSYIQRAIAIATVGKNKFTFNGYNSSDDANAAIQIAKNLGAEVHISGTRLRIEKKESSLLPVVLNCGEAGLSSRMFSPIAALESREIKIIGEGTLLNRPMKMIVDALSQFGKEIESENGFLPLTMRGEIHPATIIIDGSESSQLLTGLLIALPHLKGKSIVHVRNLKSIPYIQMTLDILAHFGIMIKHSKYTTFEIPGNQTTITKKYNIEGDWSGAAFMLVAGVIGGQVLVKGLNTKSAQGDKEILSVLEKCGAILKIGKRGISVSKNKLNSFEFDATHCPDLFPPLAALAACCEGTSIIKGIDRLIFKESNRAMAIKEEFIKLGIVVTLIDNEMHILGGHVKGGRANSRNDHRIAMALSVLSLVSEYPIEIENAKAINKSYQNFYADLNKIGYL